MPDHPCPLCRDNDDLARDPGDYDHQSMQCSACGQFFCALCHEKAVRMIECPVCGVRCDVQPEELFARWWALVHDRAQGRHTPAAEYHLALMFEQDRPHAAADPHEAFQWLRRAAEHGHPLAQYRMGRAYQDAPRGGGADVKYDPMAAVEWFRRAALQNEPAAMYRLAR